MNKRYNLGCLSANHDYAVVALETAELKPDRLDGAVFICGARPTGILHVGHLVGAFEPMVRDDTELRRFFVIADLHSLTTRMVPEATKNLPERIRLLAATLMALGMQSDRFTFYVQSDVIEQAQFFTIIQALVDHEPLAKQPSYIDMSQADSGHPSLGLLGYPVLETADMLSMRAGRVAIGEHNVHHLKAMDQVLGRLEQWGPHPFQRPEVVSGGKNIPGLDGHEKMSKSRNNAILLTDSPEQIRERVYALPDTPDCSRTLRTIGRQLHADAFDDAPEGAIAEDKARLLEIAIACVEPIRKRTADLMADPGYIERILRDGSDKARARCQASLSMLKHLLGLNWQDNR